METKNIKDKVRVFVTYAWSDDEYNEKVVLFTNHLRKNGFEAVNDIFLIQQFGSIDFQAMMLKNIREVDKVIVLLSNDYAEKADNLKGGVGTEYQLILKDINVNPQKYILASFSPFDNSLFPLSFRGRELVTIDSESGIQQLFRKLKGVNNYNFAQVADDMPIVKTKEIREFITKEENAIERPYLYNVKVPSILAPIGPGLNVKLEPDIHIGSLNEDALIDLFFGNDPVLGHLAKDELVNLGEKVMDKLIVRFGNISRSHAVQIRLAEFFGYYGERSIGRLMAVLKSGDWQKMVDATYCFKALPEKAVATKLVELIKHDHNIDIQRCAIDALGYLGAKDFGYVLIDLFPESKNISYQERPSYQWEKLSHNVFNALLNMAVKPDGENASNRFYTLSDIKSFYEIAGEKGFRKIVEHGGWWDILVIFSDFQPIAADSVINRWLNCEIIELQKLALYALYNMRLMRAIPVLKKFLKEKAIDDEMKSLVAEVLHNIPKKEAAEVVKDIFLDMDSTSASYRSTALFLSICLERLDDQDFIKQAHPKLIALGGEVAAHTYYNLGLLGFPEMIWSPGIDSEDFIIRASIALVYSNVKKDHSINKLLQIERESSAGLEQMLVLCALTKVGFSDKGIDFRRKLVMIQKTNNIRMFRHSWKREIIIGLGKIETGNALKIWENLLGITHREAYAELMAFNINN